MKAVEHKVNLLKAYTFPAPKRAKKALTLLKRFAKKHFRLSEEQVFISPEVNNMVWVKGREKPPRKIELSFFVEEQKITVLPKGKAQKILEKTKKQQKKKKEKRLKEKAGEKTALKRKTG